jgi:aryl-alcohol dehydrogenase-like predicted oxidoreductase
MFNRLAESDLLTACDYYGIGVVPYSPLARGVLTGKYALNQDAPNNSRAGRGDANLLVRDLKKETLDIAKNIEKYLKNKNITISEFAVAWLLNNKLITSVIGGPRTLAQWNSYIKGGGYELTAEDEAFVDTLTTSGHNATPNYTWPRYPIRGRRAINI